MGIPIAIYESAALGAPVLVEDVLSLKVETYQEKVNKMCIGL
jgi:hypothetical protein